MGERPHGHTGLASWPSGRRRFASETTVRVAAAAVRAMPLLVAPCVWRQLEPFAVKRDPEDKDASIQEPPGADPTPLLDDADERGASY